MTKLRWRKETCAPDELHNVIVAATITCECGKGAKVTLPAGRMNGEWYIEFNHSIDINGWMQLPEHPHNTH